MAGLSTGLAAGFAGPGSERIGAGRAVGRRPGAVGARLRRTVGTGDHRQLVDGMSEHRPIPERPEPNNTTDGGDLPVWFYVVIGALAILMLFLIVMGALEWKATTLLH